MQREKAAEAREWFRKVEEDLAAAALDLSASPPLIGDTLFHCQQAAEKAIKGFLTFHDKEFRKVHDIRKIGKGAMEVDASLEALIQRATALTPFAEMFRYPGDVGTPSRPEAEEALRLAREVYEQILTRLPEEVRP